MPWSYHPWPLTSAGVPVCQWGIDFMPGGVIDATRPVFYSIRLPQLQNGELAAYTVTLSPVELGRRPLAPAKSIKLWGNVALPPAGEVRAVAATLDKLYVHLLIGGSVGSQGQLLRAVLEPLPGPAAPEANGPAADGPAAVSAMSLPTNSQVFLAHGLGGKGVLLLMGNYLAVLDAAGRRVVREGMLPSVYKAIGERADHYVALGVTSVDLLDKQQLTVQKRIALPVAYPWEMVCHPTLPINYVSCDVKAAKGESGQPPHRVVIVDERLGRAAMHPSAAGRRLAIDPKGKYLLTGGSPKDSGGPADQRYWMNGPGERGANRFGEVNCHVIQGAGLAPGRPIQSHATLADGEHLAFSHDGGRLICYGVSLTTLPSGQEIHTIPVHAPPDFAKPVVRLPYFVEGGFRTFTFHPSRDVVIIASDSSMTAFDVKTGTVLKKVEIPGELVLKDIQQVMFAPDGRHLLVLVGEMPRPWRYGSRRQLLSLPADSWSGDGAAIEKGDK